MNWNDLKVFLAIAEAGSLAGAAAKLEHNHSTVFRRLNALEQALATRLFDRLPTGYALTPVGERTLELAREAAHAIEAIDRELAGRDLAPSGTVRLTTTADIARTLVPPALAVLRAAHPEILVEISIGDTDYDLNRREADIALRATTKPPEHLIGQKLADLCWWVSGAAGGKQPHPTTPEQMYGVPLIGADRSLIRLAAMQWLEANYKSQIVARANDLSTMAALACAGIGLAVLPSDQRETGLQRLFEVPGVKGELWLLTHPDLRRVRRIRAVWEALGREVGKAF
jgi:DNA-binding transcriptional LysR family regulator